MKINNLIIEIKKKICDKIKCEKILIEDKTFLHKKHIGNVKDKFHLKLTIKSQELKKMDKIESTKKIYNILDYEIKKYIHSLQILIN